MLKRVFEKLDTDSSGLIDWDEFKAAIRQFGNDVPESEVRTLFRGFDRNGNGYIDFQEFCATMLGELTNFRRELVERAFWTIDKMDLGQVQINEMFNQYEAS